MTQDRFKDIEKRVNDRIVDFVIGGSYLGDYWTHIFEKAKKIGGEAHAHIIIQYEKFKEWYRD